MALPLLIGAGIMGAGIAGRYLTKTDPKLAGINMKDLQRINPELAKQISQNGARIQEARNILENRRRGATNQERMQMMEAQGNLAAQQAQMGLAGSSAGAGQMGDMETRLRNQIAERAFQEEQQYYGNLQNAIDREQQSGRMGAEFLQNQNMFDYQNALRQDQENAQMWGGLTNMGMGMGSSGVSQMVKQPYYNQQQDVYNQNYNRYNNMNQNYNRQSPTGNGVGGY